VKNAIGEMAMAKSTSGQVYRADDDSRRLEKLNLRPGEAGSLSVVLRNDLGAMGTVALYADLNVQVGRLQGVRRVTFPVVEAR